MIVLHKFRRQTQFLKKVGTKYFREESTIVLKDLWRQHPNVTEMF